MTDRPTLGIGRGWLLAVLLAALVVWFGNLDLRRLVKSDEGRYAEIAREMVVTGDWVTPRLNGIKYFYKPPLQYWATAAAYRLFGVDEWTARLWNALTGLMAVLITAFVGARLYGAPAGWAAGAVLASSPMLIGMAHVLTLDMGLACFMTLALGGFLLAQRDGATPGENRIGMLAAWAGMALAVLSKGLIGVMLPGAVLVLYSLWQRDARLWTRLHLVPGLALFGLLTAPWFIAVSRANPEFPRYFFIHEHFERFLTTTHGREGPWWEFGPILLVGLLPWTLLLIPALARGWRALPAQRFQPQRLLWLWTVFIFAFFSASSSKLPSYILPIFPALALLIGPELVRLSPRTLRALLLPTLLLLLAVALAGPELMARRAAADPLLLDYLPWARAALLIVVAGGIGALLLDARGRRLPALLAAAFGALLGFQVALTGHNVFAPSMSAWALAQQIKPYLTPDVPFYSLRTYDQTLNFYIGRTVTLVDYGDELTFGLKQQPELAVASLEEFARRWQAHPQALAIAGPETVAAVRTLGVPLEVVADDGKRIVFRKP
jgi:4-amino-4-deoxy-L-arabinose transferase-like glycosyltransferase